MSDTKSILTFAIDVGQELLKSGAEVYRVEETIFYILKAFDVEDCDVYVLSNGIFASANENTPDACSIVRHVPSFEVHLGKIASLNQLSREISQEQCSLEEAHSKLEKIKKTPKISPSILVFFTGLGAACFTYLFGGSLLDSVMAFVNGLLLGYLLYHMKGSKVLKNIAGAFVVSAIAIGVKKYLPVHSNEIIIGSIMPLVPGIALTTGVRDIFHGDYLSGAIHMLDAIFSAICIAVGVGTLMSLVNVLRGYL